MKYFLYLIFFIFGACIISFLKVIAHDYPQISLTRRSHCDYCGRILRWFEIIPIVGYFIVNGKCYSCKNQIIFWNPILELIGGLFFALTGYLQGQNYLAFFTMLILLSFSDYYFGYIYPIFYLLCIPTLILNMQNLNILTAVIIYLSLLLLSRHGLIGLGDVELIALISLVFNLSILLWTLILACLLCLIVFGINKKRSFRFIPYLTIALGIIYPIFSIISTIIV
ncbi:prepilin peptidase [Lactobacillus halodurans]|uniref:Prepilin peptidase n=1 Tax=Companilactobacillus halodurans TaxID=2584183 RepID=A0A5P0ZRY4_9LACO|nr:prepilin peptidase [Companilactobacillus halodurans]